MSNKSFEVALSLEDIPGAILSKPCQKHTMPTLCWWLLHFWFSLRLTTDRNCSWCICCWSIRTIAGCWHRRHTVFLQHSLFLYHLCTIWFHPFQIEKQTTFPRLHLAIYSHLHQGNVWNKLKCLALLLPLIMKVVPTKALTFYVFRNSVKGHICIAQFSTSTKAASFTRHTHLYLENGSSFFF